LLVGKKFFHEVEKWRRAGQQNLPPPGRVIEVFSRGDAELAEKGNGGTATTEALRHGGKQQRQGLTRGSRSEV